MDFKGFITKIFSKLDKPTLLLLRIYLYYNRVQVLLNNRNLSIYSLFIKVLKEDI